jgi:hypothetical protein
MQTPDGLTRQRRTFLTEEISLLRRNVLNRRSILVVLASLPAAAHAESSCCGPITVDGERLRWFLDGTGVDHLWLAGFRVNWQTGTAVEAWPAGTGSHTHCSAFAASMAMRLGIYLLRPPQHRQNLLANAQMGWLRGPEAAADGWHTLPDAFTAQTEANRGRLVTAVFENPNPNKPGHIAIIRPGRITASALAADGPIVTQAGSHNALAVPLPRASVGTPVRGYRVAPALSASSRMMWLGYKSERPNNAISVRQDIITDINGSAEK